MGVSRSTAAAYIGVQILNPEVDELDLANALRWAAPFATPNPLMIKIADDILGRSGRMVDAIKSIGRGENAYEGSPFVFPLNPVGGPLSLRNPRLIQSRIQLIRTRLRKHTNQIIQIRRITVLDLRLAFCPFTSNQVQLRLRHVVSSNLDLSFAAL